MQRVSSWWPLRGAAKEDKKKTKLPKRDCGGKDELKMGFLIVDSSWSERVGGASLQWLYASINGGLMSCGRTEERLMGAHWWETWRRTETSPLPWIPWCLKTHHMCLCVWIYMSCFWRPVLWSWLIYTADGFRLQIQAGRTDAETSDEEKYQKRLDSCLTFIPMSVTSNYSLFSKSTTKSFRSHKNIRNCHNWKLSRNRNRTALIFQLLRWYFSLLWCLPT